MLEEHSAYEKFDLKGKGLYPLNLKHIFDQKLYFTKRTSIFFSLLSPCECLICLSKLNSNLSEFDLFCLFFYFL